MKMRVFVRAVAVAALVTGNGLGAYARTFPDRPVRIIVPCAVAGASEPIARVLAQGLHTAMHSLEHIAAYGAGVDPWAQAIRDGGITNE